MKVPAQSDEEGKQEVDRSQPGKKPRSEDSRSFLGWLHPPPDSEYIFGIWWGMKPAKERPAILRSRFLAGLAAIYLLFALFITLGWHFHSLEAYVPTVVVQMIYPIDKGDLDILRLLHFLALALLCWRLLPCNLPALQTRFLRLLVQCGEYSLAIYCVSVLLSF